jgi:hypothetical protein
MFKQFAKGTLNVRFHLKLFKTLLLLTNGVSLLLYACMHCIFFDFPFEITEEACTLAKLFSVASVFAVSINTVILLADAAEYIILQKKQLTFPGHLKMLAAALVVFVVMLVSCNGPLVSAGIKKDLTTGLSSSYTGMEPEKVFLVMNTEVLNHIDIPLGESFLLVNDGIRGMQVKNGKVKVGCSLLVSDQQGKMLLKEKDLFADHDEFEEKDAKMLKCTVSTGSPMKWEEKYNVAVTFWDKNGTGKIENKVTIRSIDMP